jgi:hypothetical protein
MAFQEGIELNRLQAHRSTDRYDARITACSRPVSQISTTDQAAEAELTQHLRFVLPDSETNSTQDTTEIASSSTDRSPLVFFQIAKSTDKENVRTTTRKQKASVPWTLRQASLLGLITFLVALIVALEVLHYYSNKNQGLVTADEDTTYLWKYFPTASKWIGVYLGGPWSD